MNIDWAIRYFPKYPDRVCNAHDALTLAALCLDGQCQCVKPCGYNYTAVNHGNVIGSEQ